LANEAVSEFKVAVSLEPDNAFAWFEMARAYGVLQDEARALLATAESRYHAGNPADAAQFARRSMEKLEKDTPEYAQALDILNAAETQTDRKGRGRRGLTSEFQSEFLASQPDLQ
jgi:predicted Zn-dependent protease